MRGYESIKIIFLLSAVLIVFTACGGETSGSVGAYTEETESNVALAEAKIDGWHQNPDGQEFIFDDAGIYIMLPDSNWRLSSQEEGCIGFSNELGLINIYYSDDDGSAYKNAPQDADEAVEILTDADIFEEWFEIMKFDFSEDKGVKEYSYIIKFNIPDEEGNYSEFYSISRSVCTGSKAYVAVGQIYSKEAVEACETAVNSFAVFS
ncbi:MAG: hypothetical protein LUG24_07060 [Clostridiales bacterium]|nr:hypothetical protein [Clostridiales bacterium]